MNPYFLGTAIVTALLATIFVVMVGWANREFLFEKYKSNKTEPK